MVQVAVVADDLTGANATGVLLGKNGLSTNTLIRRADMGRVDCDCLICPTDSRSLAGALAYNRVYETANMLKSPSIRLYSKRVDSTLRGNLGAETDAILDALGSEWLAVAVACFPQAKRATVGGRLLVNSVPLHMTEAAADPKNPIDTPVVEDNFRKQTKYATRVAHIEEVSRGAEHVAGLIARASAEGIRIFIFDAISNGDLDTIASGAVLSGVKFVAVDPGAFTAACVKALAKGKGAGEAPRGAAANKKILSVVGSVNGVAAAQVMKFLSAAKCCNVFIDTDKIAGSAAERATEIMRVRSRISAGAGDFEILSIVGAGIHLESRIDLAMRAESSGLSAEELSETINNSIAEIAEGILADNRDIAGLYTCGGDISVAVCNRLEAYALDLRAEVVPLASFGELKGGRFDGMKFVTKGGMVGDENALVACIDYLREKI